MSDSTKPVILHARLPDSQSGVCGSSFSSEYSTRQQLTLCLLTQGLFYLVTRAGTDKTKHPYVNCYKVDFVTE